jgi:ribosomal protein S12 methylthiotransferase accessory factor YcaO
MTIRTFSTVHRSHIKDIKLILNGLKRARLNRAIVADLTNPEIEIPVVRAIVPGLETFMVIESIMGRRARESFQRLHPKK